MKKILVLLVMMSSVAVAQNRSNVWEQSFELNYVLQKGELLYNGVEMDTNSVNRVMSMENSNVSIADTAGNLLFYSNGLTIGNRNYDTLQNAVDFNPGWFTSYCEPIGLKNCQSQLILPDPGNSQRYYIFHESGEHVFNYVQPLHLSYSVIDMTLDGGLGGIVDTLKNKYAIVDTLLFGGITAVKYANGRDWWIIVHRFHDNNYYKLLLTPDGISGLYEQSIGSNLIYDVVVQATFSPDGSKYCISNFGGWFDYFDFDRCTGEFSNYKTGNSFNLDSLPFFGCSFSPNNRYLYVSGQIDLYQYDTWDSNMVSNVLHVATWDSFIDPYSYSPPWFFMHQLAPDGKIYVGPWNSSLYFSVIESPDSFGTACNFQQHSIRLSYPDFNLNLPSFPNYDLGALEGSPCDTLSIPTQNSPPETQSFHLSPNPASSSINIVYSIEQNATLTFTNTYGSVVKQLTLYPYFKNRMVYVDELPAGVYLVTLHEGDKMVAKKMLIAR